MSQLHHYRNVYKSDHLSIHDLEDFIEQNKNLVFTIKEVKQEKNVLVAGKRGDFNIAYFVEPIKPLVINATNGKVLRSLAPEKSPMVEHWSGIVIELYIDPNVNLKGEKVGGVRIKKPAFVPQKQSIDATRFEKALQSIKEGNYKKESLIANFLLTPEQLQKVNEL